MKKNYTGCSECLSETRRTPIEVIRMDVESKNPNVKIIRELEKESNGHRRFECYCDIHDVVWETSLSSLTSGRGCKLCGIESTSNKRKKNEIEIKKLFEDKGIQLLDFEYKNIDTKLNGVTSEGYLVYVCPANLKNINSSRFFHSTNPHTVYNVRLYLEKNIKNLELLSEVYEKDKPLTLKCKMCGNIFHRYMANIVNHNQGCPICSILNKKGEGNPNWKGGISEISAFLRSKIKDWKLNSFKKYNFKCDICSDRSALNVIHHIYPFYKIRDEVFINTKLPMLENISNYSQEELNILEEECIKLHEYYGLGVCMCDKHHKLFHKEFGNDVSVEEYEIYKNKLINLNKHTNYT